MGFELMLRALPLQSEFAEFCKNSKDGSGDIFLLLSQFQGDVATLSEADNIPAAHMQRKVLDHYPDIQQFAVDLDRYFEKIAYLISEDFREQRPVNDLGCLVVGEH